MKRIIGVLAVAMAVAVMAAIAGPVAGGEAGGKAGGEAEGEAGSEVGGGYAEPDCDCDYHFEPVCATNERSYANPCFMECANATFWKNGQCKQHPHF